MNKLYTIKEAAEVLNISTNKIRFYENKGLISPKRDRENNYRYFSQEELIKLQTILMYRALNIPIEAVEDILQKDQKYNVLDHFYKQWQVINDELHRMVLIRNSLGDIMDSIYDSEGDNFHNDIIKTIKKMNDIHRIKSSWKDKWNFSNWSRTYDEYVKKDIGRLKIYINYERILDTVYERAMDIDISNAKFLEIGVGTGNLAGRFLNKGYNIIGIDQSRDMLNVAKEKFPNLKLRLGEFLKIPFDNKTFDVIVSTYSFHHLNIEEKIIAIAEMLRVLKDGGRIIIGDLMFENEEERHRVYDELTQEQIEEVEDEYYSNIDLLREEFDKHSKRLATYRIDLLNYIIEVN